LLPDLQARSRISQRGGTLPLKVFLVVVVVGLAIKAPLWAQEPFYKGKVPRVVVGAGAGGGLDTYSRTIARHIGQHIPGNPTIIVDNMTGAGGLILVNHLAKVAKPDGLTIGMFVGDLVILQLLGRPGVEADFVKFGYIGAPLKDTTACALTKASGITSIEAWMASKTPVKLGSTAPGDTSDSTPRILNAFLGLPVQIVSGYKGTAQIRIAAESGELAGGCWTWGSMRATWTKAIQTGEVVVVLQNRAQRHPELSSVPLAIDFAKTRDARELILSSDTAAITFLYALPPASPTDRLQTLRRAFMDTMKDPEFLADADKAKLAIDPMAGDEVERTVAALLKLEPALATKLKEVLATK
jgi:tripartite-type tricarboxylate transporter receptor subunit TctC